MRRIGILMLIPMLAAALLLGGCAVEITTPGPADTGAGTAASTGVAQGADDLLLAVSNRAGDDVINGAAVFCQRLGELSGGAVRVRLVYSEDPASTLREGGVQFAVLGSREDYAGSSLLEAGATPFLYGSYLNYSMKTNAEDSLSFLAGELAALNMRPLGAYYQGATHLLGEFGTENWQQYEDRTIAVNPDSGSEGAFAVLAATTVEVADPVERARMLLEGRVDAAEFRLDQMSLIDFDAMPGLNLTLTYHGITPVWLMMDRALYDGLDTRERAVLTEACAYLTNAIDDAYTRQEAEWLVRLLDEDVEVQDEVIGTRNRIRNNKYGKIWEITDPENAFAVEQFLSLMNSLG